MVCWPRKSPGVSTAAASTRRSPSSLRAAGSRRGRRWRCTCGSASRPACRAASRCTRCACRRGRTSIRNTSVNPDSDTPPLRAGPSAMAPGVSPGSSGSPAAPGSRRKRVLASGCGAVSTFLADPHQVAHAPARGEPPAPERLRALFKDLFGRGERYNETGGIHAAALTDDERLLFHAEDIGRHNAVDKVVGAAVVAREPITGRGLLVTGRISAELAYKAARAGLAYVATPSVPSTLAVTIARRTGIVLVGRAVSGTPHVHRPDA